MINKKLLSFDRGALRYVGANVAFQWLGMLCNVIFVRAIARLVGAAFAGSLTRAQLWQNLVLCLATVPMRFAFTMLASAMSAPCAAASTQSLPALVPTTPRRRPPARW